MKKIKTYFIDEKLFLNVKYKLDGLVFWKQRDNNKIEIKLAMPRPGLREFVEQLEISSIKINTTI